MKNPELITEDGITENLAWLYFNDNCNVIIIHNTVEENKT